MQQAAFISAEWNTLLEDSAFIRREAGSGTTKRYSDTRL